MDKQRVNKITAVFNDADGVTMALYRTHTKLGQLTNNDIGVKSFKESGSTNKPAYMMYCKEVLINLLENGGIEGYYYDPKNESEQSKIGIPKKFNTDAMAEWSRRIVDEKYDSLGVGDEDIVFDIMDTELVPNVRETYKDGAIKYASVMVPIRVGDNGGNVPVEIRSGQLCKPKSIIIDGAEKGFTATTIRTMAGKTVGNINKGATPQITVNTQVTSQPSVTAEQTPVNTEQGSQPVVVESENKGPVVESDSREPVQDGSANSETSATIDTQEPKKRGRRKKAENDDQTTKEYVQDMTGAKGKNVSKLMSMLKGQ